MIDKDSMFLVPKDASSEVRATIYAAHKEHRLMEMGWFGKCFGHGDQASKNVAGALILLFVFIGALYNVIVLPWPGAAFSAGAMWNMLCPLIALALGYLFGKSAR